MDVSFNYSYLGLSVCIDEALPLMPPEDSGTIDLILFAHSEKPKSAQLIFQQCGLSIYRIENQFYFENDNEVPDKKHLQSLIVHDVLPACIAHMGYLLIHGASVVYGDQAHIIAGYSGMGKSTLSANLIQNKLDVMSDDLVRIESSIGELKVYGLKILRSYEEYPFHRIFNQPVFQKYHYQLSGESLPYRPRSVSILAGSSTDKDTVCLLHGTDALLHLLPHVFVSSQQSVNVHIIDKLLSFMSSVNIYRLSSAAKHYPAADFLQHLPKL